MSKRVPYLIDNNKLKQVLSGLTEKLDIKFATKTSLANEVETLNTVIAENKAEIQNLKDLCVNFESRIAELENKNSALNSETNETENSGE